MKNSALTAALALTEQDILNMNKAELETRHRALHKLCDKLNRPNCRQRILDPNGWESNMKILKARKLLIKDRLAALSAAAPVGAAADSTSPGFADGDSSTIFAHAEDYEDSFVPPPPAQPMPLQNAA